MTSLYTLTSSGLTTASTGYTSGDVLGAEMTLTLAKGYGSRNRIARIHAVVSTDSSAVLAAHDLFFFTAASTPAADNAANSWSDANIANLAGIVPVATAYTSALNTVATGIPTTPIPLYAPLGVLYVVAVTRSGNSFFTAGATSITYKILASVE